jgi:UDP-N-acetylmuramyl pentapeptide phosphotransferase/UDP-N-acetylglucosamine-1-phosphate transferase
MEALVGIVLAIVVATYAWEHYHDWVVALVAIAIIVPIGGFLLGAISDRAKTEKARQEKTAADLLAAQRMLSAIITESRRAVAELPGLIRGAEKWCNQAEFEFRERAFAPFWDAIETATFNLRTFERNIQILESKAQEYRLQGATCKTRLTA